MFYSFYSIGSIEYGIYQAASGDWCVQVDEYGKELKRYNIGEYTEALQFILSNYEVYEGEGNEEE